MVGGEDAVHNNPGMRLKARRGERVCLTRHSSSPDPNSSKSIAKWLAKQTRPWAVDLFCGAGGLSLGLSEAGFSVVAAADSDAVALESHAANIPGLTWAGDLNDPSSFICQLDRWGITDIDLLAGGPPCQPFSTAGMSKIGNLVRSGKRRPDDDRVNLWRSFFAFVDRLKPKAILFENVPNFAQAQGGALLIALIEELEKRSYAAHAQVLDAWRYRVPQHRSRLFVVGIADNFTFRWPKSLRVKPTVGQAIRDLPVVQADVREEVQRYSGPPRSALAKRLRKGLSAKESGYIRDHITRAVRKDDEAIYKSLKPGGTYLDVPKELKRYRSDIFTDKYVRLSFEDLSRTITAHIAKDGYWYIHPSEDRTLSIREAARIQTFPDRFRFAGHPTNRYRQIGNAVPPLLASAIASSIKTSIDAGSRSIGTTSRTKPEWAGLRASLINWFMSNGRDFYWRRVGLSPWQFLLLEMCLHRTKASQVERVSSELFELGETPSAFLANSRKLSPLLDSLGLNWRTENLASAAEYVINRFSGHVPDNWQELVAIPGVGNYIASAVECFAFGKERVLMDTNTVRIAKRVLGKSDLPTWRLRLALHRMAGTQGPDVPWNQALLDLGALVCTSRAPKCETCPVRASCVTGSR